MKRRPSFELGDRVLTMTVIIWFLIEHTGWWTALFMIVGTALNALQNHALRGKEGPRDASP